MYSSSNSQGTYLPIDTGYSKVKSPYLNSIRNPLGNYIIHPSKKGTYRISPQHWYNSEEFRPYGQFSRSSLM